MQNENTGWQATGNAVPQWWHGLPSEEKKVIHDVLHVMRGLKEGGSPRISLAARKWDRRITCFIKFQLMGRASRRSARRVTTSPTSARNPQGASSNAG